MSNETILVVDDDRVTLSLLQATLYDWGFIPLLAETGMQALNLLAESHIDLVILDLMMPDMDGMEVLAQTRRLFSHIPFIVLSAHSSAKSVVGSLRHGAADFISKPFNYTDLLDSINTSLASRHVPEAHSVQAGVPPPSSSFQQIVSKSPKMTPVLQMARQVSSYPQTTVALYGESGVGKEVLARAIHAAGGFDDRPFVAVNCAGIPTNLLESELFGHVRGAFTGADRDREGMFCLAKGGTILLDEIGDMPLELQVKLLRVIESRTYVPVGSTRHVKVDFRIVVATHHNLNQLVDQGKFRSDLFHRVNIFPITIPPLRERKEDIPMLVEMFLSRLRMEMGKPLPGISKRGMDYILGYDWPGNVRELKNSLERAAIVVGNEQIPPSHLEFLSSAHPTARREQKKMRLSGGNDQPFELHLTLPPEDFSLKAIISKALHLTLTRCNNNKSLAAQLLKTDRRVFYRLK
ncbi:sigma-54 dependent transcriptional regulator [Geomonas subterranea]|uniref:Sigma-54 dependent transcriptional regulator n=1 Tax=Geomonas subterranea TaxID=2847989 RepID=A0ABX8LN74_9BACT|nr:sigma-54 dependent transcriptional regulator [Geomonas subterranea]QXE92397.1 sigma-54 dependent transcriptional regulator [Geomonas subterranea]QXM09504.1 sigma-54 dependent transcriptional regulator [Geomonas subterranea]